MVSLRDITLVIPAYNRPTYLERQIDFWSVTDVHLCILDGSKESAPQSLIDRMGTNVYYRHVPIGFNERLVMACDLVQTKYVALLGDDELYAPHGLKDGITQLEDDERLIACVGRTVFFFERDGAIYGHQTYEKSEDYTNPEYLKLIETYYYPEHVLRMNPSDWPNPVVRAFANLNYPLYLKMQGPSEFGVVGDALLKEWDRTEDLKNISIPTLTIGAEYDTMDPKAMEKMSRLVQNGEYLYCPQGSHMAMYDDQEVYFSGVLKFLKSLE